MSFDVILPFLRPIAHLIQDPEVSEIMVNGSRRVFVECDGLLQEVVDVGLDERNLRVAVKNIARALGDDVSEEQPILDARLPDGSRVAAVCPPCSLGGTTLTIRKFHTRFFTADELVRIGTMTPEVLATLREAIAAGANILISGGTSTGKTTILNALAMFLPPDARIIVVEDTAELQIAHANLVRLEARREQPHAPAITIRDLLRATLRHRPDRIIVGEVRGGEAFDLLQALNTGHAGSLSTIHANSAAQALARLASCALQSGVELPYQAVRQQIADAIQFVLHLSRSDRRRYVHEVIRVGRYNGVLDRYEPETVFTHEHRRSAPEIVHDTTTSEGLLDRTTSRVGQQLLYHRLRSRGSVASLAAFDALASQMSVDTARREQCQLAPSRISARATRCVTGASAILRITGFTVQLSANRR